MKSDGPVKLVSYHLYYETSNSCPTFDLGVSFLGPPVWLGFKGAKEANHFVGGFKDEPV